MMFLAPIGGRLDSGFGVLVSPGTRGIAQGVRDGKPWAADNQAFTKGFNAPRFFDWLAMMEPYRSTCLFAVCPDVVGDATETLALFSQYRPAFTDWPVAFVAQDGQENLDFPPADEWQALFIGGSTVWKMGHGAEACIRRAQDLGKHIHIGRVNFFRRYQHFASIEGSERWTCDGTRTHYGKDLALEDWQKYMATPRQYRLGLSPGDNPG
jgi:hypothetical protein